MDVPTVFAKVFENFAFLPRGNFILEIPPPFPISQVNFEVDLPPRSNSSCVKFLEGLFVLSPTVCLAFKIREQELTALTVLSIQLSGVGSLGS